METPFNQFVESVRDDLGKFIDFELSLLPSQHSARLQQSMRYSMLNGGKRIRALLCFATGIVAEATQQDLLKIASAIECIHGYSLVHDDLPAMDDDDLRRGKPTCHVEFDEATAILAGDALQTFAFELLSRNDYQLSSQQQLKIIAELSRSSGANGMCLGQSLDLESEGKDIPYESLKNIHRYKTGALITASIRSGAMAGSVNEDTLLQLTHFGDAIGLAFQIKDDILDIESSTEQLGKPQGSDSELDKATYPALIGLQESKDKCTELFNTACQCLEKIPGDTAFLNAIAELIIDREH
jgi:farnesyl diphosphate synthase